MPPPSSPRGPQGEDACLVVLLLTLRDLPKRLHAAGAHGPVLRPAAAAELRDGRDGVADGHAGGAGAVGVRAHGLEGGGPLGRQPVGHGALLLAVDPRAVGEGLLRRRGRLGAGTPVLEGAVVVGQLVSAPDIFCRCEGIWWTYSGSM